MVIGGVPGDRRVAIVAGTHDAAALLEALAGTSADVVGVVAQSDRVAGRGGLAVLTSRARVRGVPVLAPRDVTVPVAVDWLRNLALDYLVCVGWNSLLTEEMLRVPRHGTVGLRRTPLLRSRRLAAPDWALERGETLTGHTMAVLVPGSATLDDVAAASAADLLSGADPDPFVSLVDATTRLLEAELADVTVRRSHGRAPARGPAPGTPPLGLLSFDRTAEDVHRWVSALSHPHRGAFARLRGETVTIWSCEPAAVRPLGLPVGTLLGADGDGLIVTTRCGSVRLLVVQGEDAPEPATDWFARSSLAPGYAFEPVRWTPFEWMLP